MPAPALSAPFQLDDWRVDPALDRLTRAAETVKLDPRHMRVLVFLAERAGSVVTQEDLEQNVWKDVIVGPNSVYQSIAQLRRALGEDRQQPRYIETIPRKGYRVIARVGAPPESLAPAPVREHARPRAPRRWWRMALIALVVGAGLLFFLVPESLRSRFLPASTHERSVAVLPLVDLSPERSSDYLADGMTEEILSSLSLMPELKVAARTSAFAFKGRTEDVRRIGRQLDVRYVLEGTVRRLGPELRVTAQLANTRDGYTVWSQSYDRQFADVFAIQTDIAREVANALRVVLSERSAQRLSAATANVGAYDLYLLGQQLWQQRTPDTIARGTAHLERAIELDRTFAPALAGLAQAHLSAYHYSGLSLEEARARIEPLTTRAMALDPGLPETFAVRGLLRTELLDYAAAEQDLRRAIELSANYSNAHLWLGIALMYQGRPREALGLFERAAALDPLFFQNANWTAITLSTLGRHAEAFSYLRKAEELSHEHPNSLWAHGMTELRRGRPDLAAPLYERVLERAPHRTDLGIELGWIYLDLGRPDKAATTFARVDAARATDASAGFALAWSHIAAGQWQSLEGVLSSRGLISSSDAFTIADVALARAVAGDARAAIGEYARAVQLGGDEVLHAKGNYPIQLGRLHAITLAAACREIGDTARAQELTGQAIRKLETLQRNGVAWHMVDYLLASAHAVRGERQASLAALKIAVEKGWRRTWWARRDPAFALLRTDSEFVAILRDAEARAAH